MSLRYLNLGCGQRFHPDWVNLDVHPAAESVRGWDLARGLPFRDASFDVVYHSHVLEHFSKADGLQLLRQCLRVLRSGGIVRVAVPDLEQIARLYLEALRKSVEGDREWQVRYDWMMLEMYDQTVRDFPGGEMLRFVKSEPMPEREFVGSRIGGELRRMESAPGSVGRERPPRSGGDVRNFVSRKLGRLALGRKGIQLHDSGVFRASGEIHRWMYDGYSLGRALLEAGFVSPRRLTAAESAVPAWASFNLDTDPDGSVYKPDSLFMEAARA
jgi:SAM-dependent methyltransferase